MSRAQRFSALVAFISCVPIATATVELFLPGFEPQALTADVLGVAPDGATTWLLQAGQPSGLYSEGFAGSATLVEGPTVASIYYASPDGSEVNDINCFLGADGPGLCEDILGFEGITTTFPVTLRAGVNTAFPVQVADGIGQGPEPTQVFPAPTGTGEMPGQTQPMGWYYTESFGQDASSIYGFASASYGPISQSIPTTASSESTEILPATTLAPSGMSTVVSSPASSASGSAQGAGSLNPSQTTSGASPLRTASVLAMLVASLGVFLAQF